MKKLEFLLLLLACAAAAQMRQMTPSGGSAAVTACVGAPGNTTGGYLNQCLGSNNHLYVCTQAGGCTTSGNWTDVTGSGGASTSRILFGCTVQGNLPGCGWNIPAAPANAPVFTAGTVLTLAVGSAGSGSGSGGALTFVGTWVTAPTGTCVATSGALQSVTLTFPGTGVTGLVSVTCPNSSGSITFTISAMDVAATEWCTTCANSYAWKEDILPASYSTNGAISYVLESRTWDTSHAGRVTLGMYCSHGLIEDPSSSIVDAAAFDITAPGTGNFQTVTSGTLTPNSGGLPACQAGDHIWIRIKADPTNHSMTSPWQLLNATFTR